MNPNPLDSGDLSVTAESAGAYLILRSGARWSDVFRLVPPNGAVIGRASANEIVIRNDQASRRHAAINWDDGRWILQDLGSRNGTFVNGRRLDDRYVLHDGDAIQVAGFVISFSRRIEQFTPPDTPLSTDQATDDQMTMGADEALEPTTITHRRRNSRFFPGATSRAGKTDAEDQHESSSSRLLQLAFSLARADSRADAIEKTLQALTDALPLDTVGLYAWDSNVKDRTFDNAVLLATHQNSTRSYRRPPPSIVATVLEGEGQAIVARNVGGDANVSSQNSEGEIDVESVIVAPIHSRDRQRLGFVHLTTHIDAPPLDGESLDFVVGSMEILAESLFNISDRQRLAKNLNRSRRQIEQLREQLGDSIRIIGASPAIRDLSEKISLAGPTAATVLIRGESGTGKELVAAAIHACSPRREGPMLCINCAALSPTLLESELFGHEKGAFTGATERKLGKFEAADGGTLMLDEIGEMSPETQTKFLRVLEGHKFERVGGQVSIQTDVRVVAATNRDLQSMVREGKFRQDLYYRLHVIEILVPPLRTRGDDCLLIAEYFLERFNREMHRRIDGLTDAAKRKLLAYDWPGNVRELKNVIERAVVLNTKNVIDEADLLLSPSLSPQATSPASLLSDDPASIEISLAELEQQHIERVLRYTGGNKSRAATILGIERSTLDRKLKRF